MIEPTPSLIATRPGILPFVVEAGGELDVPGLSAAGTVDGAPAAAPNFARAFDGLIATAGGAVPATRPAGTPAAPPADGSAGRQILAVADTPLPDVAGMAPPPLDPSAAPVGPDDIVGTTLAARHNVDPAKTASPAKDDDDLPEPRLEPALAWLLPPPPPVALPAVVIVTATVRRPAAADLPAGQVALERPMAIRPITGDSPVLLAQPRWTGFQANRASLAGPANGAATPPFPTVTRTVAAPPIAASDRVGPIAPTPAAAPAPNIRVIPVSSSGPVSTPIARATVDTALPADRAVAVTLDWRAVAPAATGGAPTVEAAALPNTAGPGPILASKAQPTPIPAMTPPAVPLATVVAPASTVREPGAAATRAVGPPAGPVATAAALSDAPLVAAAPAAVAVAARVAAPVTRRGDDPLAPGPLQLTAGAPQQPMAVAAMGDAQQAGTDLTRDPGLHRMIDRIEMLRDTADSRDTRIRLIPDALGPVDIAVRREGEAVHVHFTASEAATRQLIADAQPRLAELAEARGVRIDRATVDGGGTGQHGQAAHRSGQQSGQQTQSNRAAPAAEVVTDSHSDQRIA